MISVIRFIRHYVWYFRMYNGFMYFCSKLEPSTLQEIGCEPYRNRFDFAFRNAVGWWKNHGRYDRDCDGKCDECASRNMCGDH